MAITLQMSFWGAACCPLTVDDWHLMQLIIRVFAHITVSSVFHLAAETMFLAPPFACLQASLGTDTGFLYLGSTDYLRHEREPALHAHEDPYLSVGWLSFHSF